MQLQFCDIYITHSRHGCPIGKRHVNKSSPSGVWSEPRPRRGAPHEGWMDGWMDDKWSGNSFLLGFSSLANHGVVSSEAVFLFLFTTYLPIS
jgi:hypothetical protein